MANEPTGENPAQNSADKPAAHRSRRRSGRSGRQPQKTAEQTSQAGSSAEQKSAEHSNNTSERRATSQPGNATARKPSSQIENSADQRAAQQPGNSVNRKSAPQPQNSSARRFSPPPQNPAAPKSALRWTWRDYLLQLSVVIAGIVVTFVGSGQIERWRKSHEVKATMQLVYDELHTNRTHLESICQKLRYDRRGMLMFQDYGMDVDKIPTDSLEKYMFIIGSVREFMLQTDALEVLKTSGLIPSIGDKQLLMETLGCYRTLDGFNSMLKFYNQRKIDALNHLFANSKELRISSDDPREGWQDMMADPMCSAFIGTAAYNFGTDETYFDELLLSVDKTAATLNDKYDFE